ncbi:hypothetical protein EWI07_12890 [Sporolactobacillus sp. THM7-4]|nr:hypothetical protein EWI07_12890 [Sporolactobacillus sp. THM7-4]
MLFDHAVLFTVPTRWDLFKDPNPQVTLQSENVQSTRGRTTPGTMIFETYFAFLSHKRARQTMAKRINNYILFIYTIIIFLLIGLNIFFSRGYQSIGHSASFSFKVSTLFLSAILIVLIFISREKISRFFTTIRTTYALTGLLTASICLQLTAARFLAVHPSWDFGVIVRDATRLAKGGTISDYFIMYPNNLLMVLILALIGKWVIPSLVVYILFNICIITFSHYLIYRIGLKIGGQSAGLVSLTGSVLFLPCIFYAPIVYTDTVSLIFLLFPLNLMMNRKGQFNKHPAAILSASLVFAPGVLLKGLLIIFVIAFSLTLLLSLKKWKKVYAILPFTSLLILQLLFNFYTDQAGLIDQDQVQRYHFPITHWLMMGQNQPHYGKYLQQDVRLTEQLLRTEPRYKVQETHIQVIQNRIRERGWTGNLRFTIEKISQTWTDGTFYTLNVLKRHPLYPQITGLLFHNPGEVLVQGYARIQLLVILTGLLAVVRLKKQSECFTFAMLSVIGFFFFLIIWETRSRYLVSLSPLLILLSTLGYFGQTTDTKKQP